MNERTPQQSWREMVRGNERFVAGEPQHPRQDVERREELEAGQAPLATLFGCSDSRLAAEIIFDKVLGDLFVVRNAGQVVSESVLGSLEYSVTVLGVPLIVVLAHDTCGAVAAAIDAAAPDAAPLPAHIANLVGRIAPAVASVRHRHPDTARPDAAEVGREHLRNTVTAVLEGSELISDAVAAGTLAIVGANYRLVEGRVVTEAVVGSI